jgi:hypothetical protein
MAQQVQPRVRETVGRWDARIQNQTALLHIRVVCLCRCRLNRVQQ